MNIRHCIAVLVALSVFTTGVPISQAAAQETPPHTVQAASAAALTKPPVAVSVTKPIGVSVVPPKPTVYTAVAPTHPGPVTPNTAIIFVGGKSQAAGDASLNTQPIPPGRARAPRHDATGYGSLNTQPIPPGTGPLDPHR